MMKFPQIISTACQNKIEELSIKPFSADFWCKTEMFEMWSCLQCGSTQLSVHDNYVGLDLPIKNNYVGLDVGNFECSYNEFGYIGRV